jgi:uncharacterized protein YdhG (YjbR/CyaY superfamily)
MQFHGKLNTLILNGLIRWDIKDLLTTRVAGQKSKKLYKSQSQARIMEKIPALPPSKDVDKYIATFPQDVQKILEKMRKVIREAAPRAEETISYGMPTFRLNGNLVHFAAHKNHIGFYPTPSAIVAFKTELASYKQSKGAVQFPLGEPVPYNLVKKIVEFRVKESQAEPA